MKKEIIYSIKSPYRESMDVIGFSFGSGEKTIAIVGSMRGDEIQQMYVCSQLVHILKEIEKNGGIAENCQIMVIPCINSYSMNIGKRFWTMDNTDINRMYPGYDLGETTQRIADGVFAKLQGYKYGIQLASFYQSGDFLTHVKIMETGFTETDIMNKFGFQYAIIRTPRPYDTTTLNYNWQIWNTKAFSLYTGQTYGIDEKSCNMAKEGILRFMMAENIITKSCCNVPPGFMTRVISENEIVQVQSEAGGIFRSFVGAGESVVRGQKIGEILNPLDSESLSEIYSEVNGMVYFKYNKPLINGSTVCYKIIKSE